MLEMSSSLSLSLPLSLFYLTEIISKELTCVFIYLSIYPSSNSNSTLWAAFNGISNGFIHFSHCTIIVSLL